MRGLLAVPVVAALAGPVGGAPDAPRVIETDRRWDVLPAPSSTQGARGRLLAAAEALGAWRIDLAGVAIDGPLLARIARSTPDDRLVAGLRDALGRPVDAGDLLLFLDDVLRAGREGRRGELVFVTPGRARRHGILLHPDDVFAGRPRRYGGFGALAIDRPEPQRLDLPQALDGDPPGPGWAMRYRNPPNERERLAALTRRTGDADLERRLRALVDQLRAQGAEVHVSSTVRSPERGYLMWGAFLLSRAQSEGDLTRTVTRLERANREWGLDVPITWRPAGDWRSLRAAAREMAETYEVVFATERGARSSNHYTGRAVDLVALDLPRRLVLEGPDGAKRVFDLSGVDEPLDLSLSPALIEWIEAHFGLRKLRSDYPHWDDAGS
jgi:hypothetical protein